MSVGIFRPRQVVQRVTVNAGNRCYIAGGRGTNRPVDPGAALPKLEEAEPVPAPPPPPPPPEA